MQRRIDNKNTIKNQRSKINKAYRSSMTDIFMRAFEESAEQQPRRKGPARTVLVTWRARWEVLTVCEKGEKALWELPRDCGNVGDSLYIVGKGGGGRSLVATRGMLSGITIFSSLHFTLSLVNQANERALRNERDGPPTIRGSVSGASVLGGLRKAVASRSLRI